MELGLADELLPGQRGEVALFHNRVKDAIQAVPIVYNGGQQTMPGG